MKSQAPFRREAGEPQQNGDARMVAEAGVRHLEDGGKSKEPRNAGKGRVSEPPKEPALHEPGF